MTPAPLTVGWLTAIGRTPSGNYLMTCKCKRTVEITPRRLNVARYNGRRLRCPACTKIMVRLYRMHDWKRRREARGGRTIRRASAFTVPASIDSLSVAVNVGVGDLL